MAEDTNQEKIENVCFESGKDSIEKFIQNEFPGFSQKLSAQLINFCAVINSYEEEGTKLRPTILFTNKIDSITKHVENSYKMVVFSGETENLFRTHIKSLIPFSEHDWNIYIQTNADGTIDMGLYRSFNSMREKNFEAKLFSDSELKAKSNSIFAFLVQSVSKTLISFKSLKGNTLNLDFSLESKKVTNFHDEISEFIDACFSKLRTTNKKLSKMKTFYGNIFQNVFKKIHGCICVVVDETYVDTGFFRDGIWLKNPIEFSKLLMQSNDASEAKLTAFSELFMDMLNYDGITIVDNKGRIRAYNVFVEYETGSGANILGGARKRAAFTIINSKVKKIIGVYFQSQEGEVFYNRNRNLKEKIRKIKISELSKQSVTLTANAKEISSIENEIYPPLLFGKMASNQHFVKKNISETSTNDKIITSSTTIDNRAENQKANKENSQKTETPKRPKIIDGLPFDDSLMNSLGIKNQSMPLPTIPLDID